MNGEREMTLKEWVERLPECHLVRVQYAELLGKATSVQTQSGDWVMVPREPTQAMIEAGHAEYEKALLGNRRNVGAAFLRRWAAMLSAAPAQGGESGISMRYFANGPQGSFATESAAFAETLISGFDREEWTVTDTEEANPQPPAASAEDVEAQARELRPPPCGWCRVTDGRHEFKVGGECPPNRSGGYSTPWVAIYDTPGVDSAITAALRTRPVGVLPEPPGGIEFGDWAAWLRDRITSMLDPYVQGPYGNQLADWLDSLEQRADTARTVSRGESNG